MGAYPIAGAPEKAVLDVVCWHDYGNFFQPCLKIFNSLLLVLIMITALFVVQPMVSLIVVLVLGSTARVRNWNIT